MAREACFADILEEKIRQMAPEHPLESHRVSETPAQQHWSNTQPWACERFVFAGSAGRAYRNLQAKSQAQNPIEIDKPVAAKKPERAFCLSSLPAPLQEAFQNLLGLGANLNPGQFHLSSLKAEYRRLLKKLHPDKNRQGQTCRESLEHLIRSYRLLAQGLSKI